MDDTSEEGQERRPKTHPAIKSLKSKAKINRTMFFGSVEINKRLTANWGTFSQE